MLAKNYLRIGFFSTFEKTKAQKIQRYFGAKTHVNFKTHFSFFAVTVEKESEELLKIND